MCLLHKAGCPLERLLSWFSSELGVGEETGALFDDCFFWKLFLSLLISSQVPFKEKDESVERLIPSGERVSKVLITKLSLFK